MEIIKRIWNFLFPEKKKYDRQPWMTDKVIEIAKVSVKEFELQQENTPKTAVHKPHYYFEHHKMAFRKQQPIGRILNFGKDRFRIHAKIASTGKFKYDVEKLI